MEYKPRIADTIIERWLQGKGALVIEGPKWCGKTTTAKQFAQSILDLGDSVALAVGPDDLLNDLRTFGLFFEAMAVRDLRVYADALYGSVYHFRNADGLECDAVVHLRNDKYGLIEIKLGGNENIEKGAETLLKLSEKIDTNKMSTPSFKMVLVGIGNYAYRRKDGVFVVPIGCLKD